MTIFNQLVIPAIRYSMCVVRYPPHVLKAWDQNLARTVNIEGRMLGSAIRHALYLPVEKGGKGLLRLEHIQEIEILGSFYHTGLTGNDKSLTNSMRKHLASNDTTSTAPIQKKLKKCNSLQRS